MQQRRSNKAMNHDRYSSYMGSKITAGSNREFMNQQRRMFIERHNREILDGTQETISTEELDVLADRFAKYQRNKENKHFKAWKKGQRSFVYKGTKFPVMSEALLKNTSSYKEILKVEEENDKIRTGEGKLAG